MSGSCIRPGCVGQIDRDGYCDRCGRRPARAADPNRDDLAPAAQASMTSVPSQDSGSASGSWNVGPSTLLSRLSRGRGDLGAGLVAVEPISPRDPASAVLIDPYVPQHKRVCSKCANPVGLGRGDQPERTDGFCTVCGRRYSFSPKLNSGDLVGGQYEVSGCLAHGGMGWLYLARDRAVDHRWVVLKGLLDSGDESAMAAAIGERKFLAQVSHPKIVDIFNFVEHEGAGYIVMEYLAGASLRDVRQARREDQGTPLPLSVSLAYCLEVLSALGFLHSRGLVYCDLKPDNVIQTEEVIKLIDLGGVHRIDDDASDIYGTIGYQAPEIRAGSRVGPSVASDLYTVGRMLAVLTVDFAYHDENRYVHSLPPAAEVGLFRRFPAFHDLLLRATDPDPACRFASAEEMSDQMFAVLRQVVASEGGEAVSMPSGYFTGERISDPDGPTWRSVPLPVPDQGDPAAGLLANLYAATPQQVLAALRNAEPSVEVVLRQCRAHLESGDVDSAWYLISGAPSVAPQERCDPDRVLDWRLRWWLGAVALARGDGSSAVTQFRSVARWLPGELAPRLAMAVSHELCAASAVGSAGPEQGGDRAQALGESAALYQLVATTDPTLSSARFGAARVLALMGDRNGAVEALAKVPSTSMAAGSARTRSCQLLCVTLDSGRPSRQDLVRASALLDDLRRSDASPLTVLQLQRGLLMAALEVLRSGLDPAPEVLLANHSFTEVGIRTGVEGTLRAMAALTSSQQEREALVDQANLLRPWTRR